jgi:hypothetical protein
MRLPPALLWRLPLALLIGTLAIACLAIDDILGRFRKHAR